MNSGLARGESLPFKLGLVRTEDQFSAVCRLRTEAYGRHTEGYGDLLTTPELMDFAPGVLVIYVQDKDSGEIVGTARLQTNSHEKLAIARGYPLPDWITTMPAAEICKFAILPGYKYAGRQLNKLILKACYKFCLATQISWIVIGARPGLDKAYISLGFKDLDPLAQGHLFEHGPRIKHRVLYLDVNAAERNAFESKNPVYRFMFETYHPDIELFASLSGAWQRPRFTQKASSSLDTVFPPII